MADLTTVSPTDKVSKADINDQLLGSGGHAAQVAWHVLCIGSGQDMYCAAWQTAQLHGQSRSPGPCRPEQ